MSSIPPILEIAADILCEFFEVVIHSFLYVRELYPPGAFEKRLKYGIPVHICVHPELEQYITSCLLSLKPMLTRNEVAALVIAILDPSDSLTERFVLELPFVTTDLGTCTHVLDNIAGSLRAACLCILTCKSGLKPLPKDCRFVVQAHAREIVSSDACFSSQNFNWINVASNHSSIDRSVITPLGVSTNVLFKMQLLLETKGTDDEK